MSNERELAMDIPTWQDLPFGGAGEYVKLDANAAHAVAAVLIAKGWSKPAVVTTAEELDDAIRRSFEEGECLVLMDRCKRPWIIWEDEYGDPRVNSWPQEEDPNWLTIEDIERPATVLHVGGSK